MVANFRKKQKSGTPDSFFSSPFIKVGFLIIIIFLIFADIKVYKEKNKLDRQIDNLEKKIQTMQDKNNMLEEGIARSDDREYIEKIAREELDLQMKDETVVSFIMPKQQEDENKEADKNYWNPKNWLGWFSSIISGIIQ